MSTSTVERLRDRKATWEMSAPELARVVADHCGWEAHPGGYLKDAAGATLAHGWDELAERLVARRWIVPGRGVDWPKVRTTVGPRPRKSD